MHVKNTKYWTSVIECDRLLSVSHEGGTTMKSKRILFVLFTCVFALFGCVSASALETRTENKNVMVSGDTMDKLEVFQQESMNQMQVLALKAYTSNNVDTKMYTNVRDAKGIVVTKKDFEQISQNIYQEAKQNTAIEIAEIERQKKQAELEKQALAAFTPRITTYGLDCIGCQSVDGRGGTAMGVQLDLNLGVMLPDGSWQPGVKYGDYYIIAADKSVPMCSIVKISDHGFSGSDITPDQPFYAMVLDRGGGISGSHLDLYTGSQLSPQIQRIMNTSAQAQIIRMGGQSGSSCPI